MGSGRECSVTCEVVGQAESPDLEVTEGDGGALFGLKSDLIRAGSEWHPPGNMIYFSVIGQEFSNELIIQEHFSYTICYLLVIPGGVVKSNLKERHLSWDVFKMLADVELLPNCHVFVAVQGKHLTHRMRPPLVEELGLSDCHALGRHIPPRQVRYGLLVGAHFWHRKIAIEDHVDLTTSSNQLNVAYCQSQSISFSNSLEGEDVDFVLFSGQECLHRMHLEVSRINFQSLGVPGHNTPRAFKRSSSLSSVVKDESKVGCLESTFPVKVVSLSQGRSCCRQNKSCSGGSPIFIFSLCVDGLGMTYPAKESVLQLLSYCADCFEVPIVDNILISALTNKLDIVDDDSC